MPRNVVTSGRLMRATRSAHRGTSPFRAFPRATGDAATMYMTRVGSGPRHTLFRNVCHKAAGVLELDRVREDDFATLDDSYRGGFELDVIQPDRPVWIRRRGDLDVGSRESDGHRPVLDLR